MANDGKIRGRNASISLTTAANAWFCLTGNGNEVTIDYSAALLDTSTYGNTTTSFLPDILDYTVSYSGYWSGSGADSTSCQVLALIGASAGTCFRMAPAGSLPCACGTCPTYSGCVNVESANVGTPAAGLVTMSFTLRPRAGDLTFATGSWTA